MQAGCKSSLDLQLSHNIVFTKPQKPLRGLVDASVRFGDVHGAAFGGPKGWLGGAIKRQGIGRYKLCG